MSTRFTIRLILGCALLAAIGTAADAAPAHDPTGHWQGPLQGLKLVLHVDRDSAGALHGTLDSPDQGALGLKIDPLTFVSDTLRARLPQLNATYVAAMSADGSALSGMWSQGGFNLPLTMKRSAEAAELKRPQEPKPPLPYRSEEVKVANAKDGVTLAGTFTAPSTGGPFPAVVLITGSGPENRDEQVFGHRPFLVLSDHLTRKGIAVLRVDDRGVGGSTGTQRGATSEDFADDALACVAFLAARKDVDAKHIGLVGHSEGGMIAPLAAVRSKQVAFVVMLAGPGIPGDSLLLLQNTAVLRSAGIDDAMIAMQRAGMRKVLAAVRQGGDSATVFRATRDLIEAQLAAIPGQQRPSGSSDSLAIGAMRQFTSPWMRYFIAFDPRPALAKLTVPVLAINGSRDIQVTPTENLRGIRETLEKAGHRQATVKELPGLNHLFQTCTTCSVAEYAQLEETMSPAALDEVSGWILRTAAKR